MLRTMMVAALLLGLLVESGAAQGAEVGRILGRVVDGETGRALPGAQLVVQGTRVGSLAGVDGRFVLVNVPSGRQTLVVSYLGYTTTSTDLEVPAGGAVVRDVALTPGAVAIEGVVVSAERERGSIGQALNEQRTAIGVMSAITAEQIARSPDGDAAAAVQRVSGVTVQDGKYVFVRGLGERYTTTSLNGARVPSPEPERRVVPLDLFPAGLLSSITTSKTFTPNLPGDFSGAQVDIRTREFPARRHTALSFSLGGSTAATGRSILAAPASGSEWLAFGLRERQLPEAARLMNGGVAPGPVTNEIVNSFRNVWSPQEATARPASSLALSLGGSDELFGRQVGYLLSGTYSHGQEAQIEQRRARWFPGADGRDVEWQRFDGSSGQSSVTWGGLANFSTMLGSHSRIAFNNTFNRAADNEARLEEGIDENTASRVRIARLRYVERFLRSNQLLGEHQLTQRQRLDWSVSSSAVSREEPDRSEFVSFLPAQGGATWFDDPEGAVRSFGGVSEWGLEGAVNYGLTLGGGARPHQLSFGGLGRYTRRSAESLGYQIRPRGWTATDPRWQLPPEQIFDGRFSNGGDANFLLQTVRAGGSYQADDILGAGYGMLELSLAPRLRLVGGARLEHSDVLVVAENMQGLKAYPNPVYTDLLPSASLNYHLGERQNLRFSASQTLARPEYREIAPVAYREVLGADQVIGNPDLKRTLIRNLDLRWELYPGPSEVLSVALFGKLFRDPIEQRYLGRSGTDTRSFYNAESAQIYGIELEVRRELGFVAAPLVPFAFAGNLTLMNSRVRSEPGMLDDRPMVGQAPYVANASLTYASAARGASATLLYNVVGRRIVSLRPSGEQVPDVYELPRQMLDLSLRLPLGGGWAAKADAKNLLDAPYETVQGTVTREFHRSGRAFSVGMSWQP